MNNKFWIFILFYLLSFNANSFDEKEFLSKNKYGFLNINIGDSISLKTMKKVNENLTFIGFFFDNGFKSAYSIDQTYKNMNINVVYIADTKSKQILIETITIKNNNFECFKDAEKYKNYYTYNLNAKEHTKGHSLTEDGSMNTLYYEDNNIMISIGCIDDNLTISLSKWDDELKNNFLKEFKVK